MVCPEREIQAPDEAEFRRSALLLLSDIRDYTKRTCEAVERVLSPHSTDPRYREPDLYKPRLHPSDK